MPLHSIDPQHSASAACPGPKRPRVHVCGFGRTILKAGLQSALKGTSRVVSEMLFATAVHDGDMGSCHELAFPEQVGHCITETMEHGPGTDRNGTDNGRVQKLQSHEKFPLPWPRQVWLQARTAIHRRGASKCADGRRA